MQTRMTPVPPACKQLHRRLRTINIQRNTGNIKVNYSHILEGQKVLDKMSTTLRLHWT